MPRAESWEELSAPKSDEGWTVRQVQGSVPRPYTVKVRDDRASCTCRAAEFGNVCKHVKALREELGLTAPLILEVASDE